MVRRWRRHWPFWFDEEYWERFMPELAAMRKEMERRFAEFPSLREPYADISETDNEIAIKLDMPGVTKKDIDIVATEDYIEVKAERKEYVEEKKKKFYRQERAYRSYYRKLPLPLKIIPEKMLAEYKDGVLTITAPKKEKVKLREKKTKVKVK